MLDHCTAVYEAISACILCWQWSNKLLQFVSFISFWFMHLCSQSVHNPMYARVSFIHVFASLH